MFCNCDLSDTDGSEPDRNRAGDTRRFSNQMQNFNSQQPQNYGQPNAGFGSPQKQGSFSAGQRTSQTRQQLPQERTISQSRMPSLPGCTCGSSGRPSATLQQMPQQQQRASQQQLARTSFSMGGSPPGQPGFPPEYQGIQQVGYAPPQQIQRPPSQTFAGDQPRENERLSQSRLQQQSGSNCQANVCKGGQTSRTGSQTSTSGQQQIPPNMPPGGGPGAFNPNQFAQTQQMTNSQQIISPCCVRSSGNAALQQPPQESECGCGGASRPPNEGSLCFCPDNPGPPQELQSGEPLGDFQQSGTDVCQSCAEFESQPVEEIKAPVDDLKSNTDEAQNAGDESDKQDQGSSGKKQNGFYQQLQFQICQQFGGGGNDNDESKNQQSDQQSEGENAEACGCGSGDKNENSAVAPSSESNGRKSGKTWQQLTLDIFQSQDPPNCGAEGSDSTQQQGGWNQQLRLMIYQEKSDDGDSGGNSTVGTNNDSPTGENQSDANCPC